MWRNARDLRWKLKAATTSPAAKRALVERVAEKRLIFSINAGRTGSKTLARLFSLLPGVDSRHEPKPNFVWALREAQTRPQVATDFLIGAKLPDIARSPERIYFESSHLFGKGFYEPMLALGLRPDLLMLGRDARATAVSHFRIGSAPARTEAGRRYLIDPGCPNMLPIPDWQDLNDYQLCYWYALETRARQQAYADRAAAMGSRIAWLEIEDIGKPRRVAALLAALDLHAPPEIMAVIEQELDVRHNTRPDVQPPLHDLDLDALERQVEARIGR